MASGCWCGRDKALANAIQREVQTALGRISEALPQARNIHLLRARDGTVLYPQIEGTKQGGTVPGVSSDTLVPPNNFNPPPASVLLALFRSGTQLGSSLNVESCSGVHIRGVSTVVSTYMLREYLLSFNTPTMQADGTVIDPEGVDRALRPLLEDLELILSDIPAF